MLAWLKEERKAKRMAQSELASLIGCTQGAYSNIEIGKKIPTVKAAKKIAEVLGFDWTRFYEESEGNRSPEGWEDAK